MSLSLLYQNNLIYTYADLNLSPLQLSLMNSFYYQLINIFFYIYDLL